jgi:tRNA threonylcarbamoyladenosine biosynthesis protein TsaB
MVTGDGSPLIKPQVASISEALVASRFGTPHLVGNAAQILADRWPADAPSPFMIDPQPAPDIAWVAWLGAAVSPEEAPARPFYLRAPDAKPPKDLLSKDPLSKDPLAKDPLAEAAQPSAS